MTGAITYPVRNTFNAVTTGRNTIVTLVDSVKYVINQMVSFRCPPTHGTIELDGLTAKIIALDTTANTITVNINSSDFTAFIAGAFTQPAEVLPAGEINTAEAAFRNNLARGGYTVIA